jgi:hypothetical protein
VRACKQGNDRLLTLLVHLKGTLCEQLTRIAQGRLCNVIEPMNHLESGDKERISFNTHSGLRATSASLSTLTWIGVGAAKVPATATRDIKVTREKCMVARLKDLE